MKRFSSADARPAGTGPEAPAGRSARVDRPRAGSAAEDRRDRLDQLLAAQDGEQQGRDAQRDVGVELVGPLLRDPAGR